MENPVMYFEREEVIRRLLIFAEAVSKLPNNLLINFSVNFNILDKDVKAILDGVNNKCNSAYQAPFKLQMLDDTKGVADNLLKSLGFSTDTKENKPFVPPPPSNDTIRFSSDDPNPPEPSLGLPPDA